MESPGNLQARPERATMVSTRLSGSFRFSQGMERGWMARLEDKWSGTQASVAGESQALWRRVSAVVKCLRVNGLGFAWESLPGAR